MKGGSTNSLQVDKRTKNELKKSLVQIKDVQSENEPKKIFLVEKKWHDQLVQWITDPAASPPSVLSIKSLVSSKGTKPNIKKGVDFEIIENQMWNKISQIFGKTQKIEAYYMNDLKTGQPVVLLNSLVFNVVLPRKAQSGINKVNVTVDPSWVFSDIKNYICQKYQYEPTSDYALFLQFKDNQISDTTQAQEFAKSYSKNIELKPIKIRNISSTIPNKKRLPSVKTGHNSRLTHVGTNSLISSTLKKNEAPIFEPKTGTKQLTRTQTHSTDSNKSFPKTSTFDPTQQFNNSSTSVRSYASSNINKDNSNINFNQITNKNNADEIISHSPRNLSSRSRDLTTSDNNGSGLANDDLNDYINSSKSTMKKLRERNNSNNSINHQEAYQTSSTTFSNPSAPPVSTSVSYSPRNSSFRFPKPVGLDNLGNTCFFNSAVQCITRVQPLTDFILSPNFESQINTSNPKSSKGRIAHAYKEFLEGMCRASGSFDPTELRRAIISKFKRFANYGQHDSQELLCSLLDGLHEDLNQSAAAKGRNAPIDIPKDADSLTFHLSVDCSPIVDLFHGSLFSSVSCPECGHIETVRDPFMFLTLEIPRKYSAVKLDECLQSFSRSDVLDSRNKWKCDGCHKFVCATKEMGVEKLAKILIIHLKRFSGEGYYASKIDTPVDYPDVLNSSSFAKKSSGNYRLIGAVFHSGGLGGGHYTAAAIDPASGRWYNFNDSMASSIDSKGAHSGRAYILFYQQSE